MKKNRKPLALFLFLFLFFIVLSTSTITIFAAVGDRTSPYSAWDNHRFTFQQYSWDTPKQVEMKLIAMYTGEEANYLISNENMFNREPAYDEEWILMGLDLKYVSGPEEPLDASDVIWSEESFFTSSGQKITPISVASFSNILKGYSEYDVSLYPGGESDVWYGILVKKSVGFPLIRVGTGYDVSTYQAIYKWFSTDPNYYENILPPTSLKASSASYNSISASWSPVTGAIGYEIYRSTSSTGDYSLISTISSTSFMDVGLTTGTTYYYKVRAYTTFGTTKIYSDYSSVVSAKPALSGWVKDYNGKWYYYKSDGSLAKGWLLISGKWYYFDTYGIMQTGWKLLGSKWYYFNTDGTMVTGWKLLGTKKYYFDTSGAMVIGWKLIDNKWYYFDSSGAMKTGWFQQGTKWYYLDSNGAMVTGWKLLGTKKYYFDTSGAMATDWKLIDNKWYYFDSSGAMKTGWFQQGTKWYYLDSSGAMVTGWVLLGGRWYYFDNSGVWIK